MSIRRRASDWRMRRETCICADADPLGDLRLGQVVLEAQAQDLAGRARRARRRRRRAARASRRARARRRLAPSESASVMSSPVGSSSERVRRALTRLDRRQRPPRRAASTAAASSCTVGERPSSLVSPSRALATRSWSSCRPRGTRIAHVLSRKWRLISPSTVGVAYDEKRTSRVRSKPSIAFMMPDAGDLHEVVERLAAAGVATRPARGPAAASPRRAGRARDGRRRSWTRRSSSCSRRRPWRAGDGLALVHAIARAYSPRSPGWPLRRGGARRPLPGAAAHLRLRAPWRHGTCNAARRGPAWPPGCRTTDRR